jgi:hypothetical protein
MSALEPAGASTYGTIVVVGGGCYGGFYVRQLGRAHAARALHWSRVVVVDRDPDCAVARALAAGEIQTPDIHLEVAEWQPFFRRYLDAACEDPDRAEREAIVPSPLMPHLMFDWILGRAVKRWPGRVIGIEPMPQIPGIPWQRDGADGTHYVSFAEWICPVNCIEPATCPKTRGPRSWTMPAAVESFIASARERGEAVAGSVIFHCTHRAFGVGMLDTATAVRADALIQSAADPEPLSVLVGTMSHCHGALAVLTIGAGQGVRSGSID